MAETTSAAPREKVGKAESVRRAMAELGPDASRADLQAYVKQHFGHEMTLDNISNHKTDLAKKAGGTKKPAPKKPDAARKAPAMPAAARDAMPVPPPAPSTNGDSVRLDDVLAVMALVERVGARNLRTLIDALSD